jgi:hypothetical protein
MNSIEWRTAVAHIGVALRHPRWGAALLFGGRSALLRAIVGDSLASARRRTLPRALEDIAGLGPGTPIGELGAIQEYLYYYVRLAKPTTVVETGVFRGISTAFILAALEDNRRGQLTSIDLPSASYVDPSTGVEDSSVLGADEETGFSVPDGLRSRWALVRGDVRDQLPWVLSRLGTIDFFLHDSEHTYVNMKWEFELASRFVPPGGMLLSDDIGWNTAFDEFRVGPRVDYSCAIQGKLGVARLR